MKRLISKFFASYVVKKLYKDQQNAVAIQANLLSNLVDSSKDTVFGKDHKFNDVIDYPSFVKSVPIRDYEGLKTYFDRIKEGEADVMYPGKPIYLSKTSGTTSGAKYIPITNKSISNHINSARNALLCYINETGNTKFIDGKMIFLQGSPTLDKINGINTGRLSGIVAHHVPKYLHKNRMPTYETNCIDDWEEKVDSIVEETLKEDMRLISGIPPWVQMYFEKLIEKTNKKNVSEIFPNFDLLVYGGVNFKPYQKSLAQLIGKELDHIELYPASEGFIAFQDKQEAEGMLLNVNSGIFFEFVPADEIGKEVPRRLNLSEVELNQNYAIVLTSNAGLWAYSLGDTVKFVSLNPFRIVVTGRTKHFISAFGEHVIAEEVEDAITYVSENLNLHISEFHVAPMVNPKENELPHHEWFIEIQATKSEIEKLAKTLDDYMLKRNSYYRDLRDGNILGTLKISLVQTHGFSNYMKSMGKLGGQNKLPRLSNDRKIADALNNYKQ